MVQISYHIAMVIFQLFNYRFDNMKSVSEMTQYMEILLPCGVKLTKVDRRYYIKYYSPHHEDWEGFCEEFGRKFSELIQTNILPRSAESALLQNQIQSVIDSVRSNANAGVRTNPDGSGSFTGTLIGMGF